MDRMEKLRIAAMIPESISEISYANEESDNTTLYNMGQNKTTERNENFISFQGTLSSGNHEQKEEVKAKCELTR